MPDYPCPLSPKPVPPQGAGCLEPADAGDWDRWLAANGASSTGVWLVYRKIDRNLTYAEALDAALCHGWIDSTIHGIDEARYRQRFTPRKPGSKWSSTNVGHMARLRAAGRLTATGLAVFPPELASPEAAEALAKQEEESRRLAMPPEYEARILADDPARATWETLAPSHKVRYAQWVTGAKQEETRLRRLDEAIRLLSQGVKALLK